MSSIDIESNFIEKVPTQPHDIKIQYFADPETYAYTAKVPIIVMGSWKHPVYGALEYTQEQFNQVLSNWSSKAIGYEPPLFLGHPVSKDVMEGAGAEAFLEKLYQEDYVYEDGTSEKVLFGEFDFVDTQTYEDVAKGKYRYASAELLPDAVNKETGVAMGLTLIGCALTNRPFLTKMPRVEVVQRFSDTFTTQIIEINTLKDLNAAMSETPEPISQLTVEQFSVLAQKVEVLTSELNSTKVELSEARKTLADQALDRKLTNVQSLTLDSDTKQEFSDLIKGGTLDSESEAKITQLMQKLSEDNRTKLTTVQGVTEEAVVVDKANFVNPYEAIIARNLKLSEDLKAKRQLV